jgi:hypothetical protein
MNKIKISHLVLTLALIAALGFASLPMAPAHALSNSSVNAVTVDKPAAATALAPYGGWVCKSATFWRQGHKITIRRCHRVGGPNS